MEVVHQITDLERYMRDAVVVSGTNPVLIDRFLNNAIEVDVDALCDGTDVYIGGIMEHIEEAAFILATRPVRYHHSIYPTKFLPKFAAKPPRLPLP
jgi:carbamoylphosphate synthase large subunit